MGIALAVDEEVWNSFSLGMKNFFTFHAIVTKYLDGKITALHYSSGYHSNSIKKVLDRDSIPYEERIIGYEEEKEKFDSYGNYVTCDSVF